MSHLTDEDACLRCGGTLWRDFFDGVNCGACGRAYRAGGTKYPSEHAGPHVTQRDFPGDSEGPLEPPERDGREQVIYENTGWDGEPLGHYHAAGCHCWDCRPQLGPTAHNH